MPKTLVAQNVTSVNPLHFINKDGIVNGLICNCEVNYGDCGLTYQVDLWSEMTSAQKQQAQSVYNFLAAKIRAHFGVE